MLNVAYAAATAPLRLMLAFALLCRRVHGAPYKKNHAHTEEQVYVYDDAFKYTNDYFRLTFYVNVVNRYFFVILFMEI